MKSVDLCHKFNQIKGIKFKSKYNFLNGSIAKFTWCKFVDHSAIVNACEILGPGRGMVGWCYTYKGLDDSSTLTHLILDHQLHRPANTQSKEFCIRFPVGFFLKGTYVSQY